MYFFLDVVTPHDSFNLKHVLNYVSWTVLLVIFPKSNDKKKKVVMPIIDVHQLKDVLRDANGTTMKDNSPKQTPMNG